MKRAFGLSAALLFTFGLAASANADLILRGTDSTGVQLIYDNDLNVTWYDWTHAGDIWTNQDSWATGLSVDFGGAVFNDWRLPTALNQDGTGPCGGLLCIDSEMGHLYYMELGNASGSPLNTGFTDGVTGAANAFNFLSLGTYWSGTNSVGSAWDFSFSDGTQYNMLMFDHLYSALAVRTGDVAANTAPPQSSVPEPSTLLLLGSGLAGLAAAGRLRPRK